MLNYANLVVQGRAKSVGNPWSAEELEALLTLENERHIDRRIAADYIRNGILTVEDYDKAEKAKFKPLDVKEAKDEAEKTLASKGKKAIKKVSAKKK